MDSTTELLASYATSLRYQDLTPEAVHQVKRRLIDSLGCALGALHSQPASIARTLATRTSHASSSSIVLGSNKLTSPEMATFANTVMVRYLDCNDTYFSAGGGHPSDMIPAVLAAAGPVQSSGQEVITAIALEYEAFCALSDQMPLGEMGWDQGILVAVGVACGAARIMGCSAEQASHAISLAVVPNLSLGQTRVGELSMWKGCATAAAARAGVFAAMLAKEGMTGPEEPFEGRRGLWEQVGCSPHLGPLGGGASQFMVTQTGLKYFPSQIHTQAPIWMALALRQAVALDEIQSVTLETYRQAWSSAGSDPAKWDPQTRETADHSLPYLIAVALKDGEVTPHSFADERIGDPNLRPLMGKIAIVEKEEFTRQYPTAMASRMEVVTRSGRRLIESASHPKGHPRNPLSDGEVEEKFYRLAGEALLADSRHRLLEYLWHLERLPNLGQLFDLLWYQPG